MLKLVAPSLAAILLLGGCQFIPGTPEFNAREGEKAVAMTFPDPATTQFQDSRQIHTTLNDAPNVSVCGLVNTKNLMGAYTGFKRYVHNKGRTLVDPMAVTEREVYIEALEECARALHADRQSGMNIRARIACPVADERLDEQLLQRAFEKVYQNNCGSYLTTEKQRSVANTLAGGDPP